MLGLANLTGLLDVLFRMSWHFGRSWMQATVQGMLVAPD